MFSVLLLVIAAGGIAVGVAGLPAWQRSQSNLLLFCLLALGAVAAESLLAGLGRWLGPGPQLRGLYALPALVATFAWPLSLFTLATLSRRLGSGWARIDWGHGAVCLFAVALLVYGLQGLFGLQALGAACWQDVVWYLREVPAALACPGETPAQAATGRFPVVAGVLAGWLVLGVDLWRRERWPWLCLALLAGAILLLLPPAWGPLPRYLGLSLSFGAIAREVTRRSAALAPQAAA